MIIKNIKIIIGLVIASVLNGCASFPQNELAQVEPFPNMDRYTNKPSVYVDFNYFRGQPHSASAREVNAAYDVFQPMIENVIINSRLFDQVAFHDNDKQNKDYTIQINAYNHGNEAAAMISGFITGYSLGLIPGAATDNYTLTIKVLDKSGKTINEHENKDSVTTWVGLWFIPAMANTPEKAVLSTLENQIRTALKQLIESGSLKYSVNQWHYMKDNSLSAKSYVEPVSNVFVL